MANKTFEVLDKDIKYEHVGHGFYDRKLESGDYINAENLEALSTACLITIMTMFGELTDNPTYGPGFGCDAWSKIKKNKTRLTLMQIRDNITDALQSISRIKKVNDVNVTEVGHDELKVIYSVTAINDQILNGGVVLG